MGVSKTTVQHWIVASTIRVHSNLLKPILTEENKLARLLMAIYFQDPQDPYKYQDMCDCIHFNRNMSKSKGWTLQSSLLTLWMEKTRVNNQTKIDDDVNLLKTL